jgi:cellulase/cellobiase CelA1
MSSYSSSLLTQLAEQIKADIMQLTADVAKLRADIAYKASYLVDQQEALQRFLEQYYQAVSPLCMRLHQLNTTLGLPTLNQDTETEMVIVQDNASSLHLKDLFYTLAKRFHPDCNNAQAAKEKFIQAKEAYQAQDVYTLLQLNEHSANDTPSISLEAEVTLETEWEQRYHEKTQLTKTWHRLCHKESTLLESASYQLFQKATWERACGNDLIAMVVDTVGAEITQKERLLQLKHRTAILS